MVCARKFLSGLTPRFFHDAVQGQQKKGIAAFLSAVADSLCVMYIFR
jgi:PhoPQ-activated pathogenicity-related protein